jgi:Flp pilus assembly protein TadD
MSVLSDRSYLYWLQGRNQQALERVQQILPVFPYDQQVFVVAALAVYEQDPQQALSFAQQAVKLAPKGDLAHYALGMALLKAGQAEQAAGELRSSLDLYWERAGAAAYKAQAEAALQALK